MPVNRRVRLVASATVLATLSFVPSLVAGEVPWGWGVPGVFAVMGPLTALLGAAIDRAEPGHRVAGMFMYGGVAASAYQVLMNVLWAGEGATINGLAAVSFQLWAIPIGLWFTGVGLFPDGTWAFPAARWVVWAMWVSVPIAVVSTAVSPAVLPEYSPNPFEWMGAPAWLPAVVTLSEAVIQFVPLALAVGHLSTLRGVGNLRRRQVGVFVVAVAFMGLAGALSAFLSQWDVGSVYAVLEVLGLLGIVVAVTVAITRYRLYEIDRLVSRTVTYAAVVVLLGFGYLGLVLVLRSLLPVEGPLPVALSTLAVAFAFLPLARWVQGRVDRRFFRSRYDAAVVVASFAGELRSTVDPVRLVDRTEQVVGETFQAEAVRVWLAERAG